MSIRKLRRRFHKRFPHAGKKYHTSSFFPKLCWMEALTSPYRKIGGYEFKPSKGLIDYINFQG
jgi:hypothetical protein